MIVFVSPTLISEYFMSIFMIFLKEIFQKYTNNELLRRINYLKTALNCNRSDPVFENRQQLNDIDDGPEWIKELNKLITTVDGEYLKKKIFFNFFYFKLKIQEEPLSESTKEEIKSDYEILDEKKITDSNRSLAIPIIKSKYTNIF